MSSSEVDQRVYLHVGLPTAGTAYLQTSLLRNRKGLREAGVLYPGNKDRMFLAAVDVRGTHKAWGLEHEQVRGAWDDLCRRARAHDGVTVLSHDLLAAASPRRITAALTMLKDLDVHVVVTVRDPARQIAAEWQEGIRHGRRLTFEQFRAEVLDGRSETEYARRFRAAHDLPDVLARWGSAVSADHLHVVCAPPPAAPKRVLWDRFAEVVGFDAAQFRPVGQEAFDASLGTDETDLLRRVNVALDERIAPPEYGAVVDGFYARALQDIGRSPEPALPAQLFDDLRVTGERWVKEIDQAGFPVYGELTDLLPERPEEPLPHPDAVEPRAQVESATWATAELLVELARQRTELARLEQDNSRLQKRRKKLKRKLREARDDDRDAE